MDSEAELDKLLGEESIIYKRLKICVNPYNLRIKSQFSE